MGWTWLVLIGIATAGVLWWAGIGRSLWMVAGAALMLGAAGYALQGRPRLVGHPTTAGITPIAVDPGMVMFRSAIIGTDQALTEADARLASGDADGAVQGLLAAVARHPDSAALWTGLGSAIAAHDGATVSPTAVFAFRRAVKLAPNQPGPPFFLGLAYVNAGEIEAAKPAWDYALSLTPRDAPYRPDIAERVLLIDQVIAMAARERR